MPNVDFVSVLAELKNGRAHVDCSRKLSELVAAVCETKKKGKLVLQLLVEPSGLNEDGNVSETSVGWQCVIAKPEHDTGKSLFFVTKDGRLTRNDPAQEELFAAHDSAEVEETVNGRD